MVTARLAFLSLALAGCSTTNYVTPGLDYSPGAFRAPDGAARSVAESVGR